MTVAETDGAAVAELLEPLLAEAEDDGARVAVDASSVPPHSAAVFAGWWSSWLTTVVAWGLAAMTFMSSITLEADGTRSVVPFGVAAAPLCWAVVWANRKRRPGLVAAAWLAAVGVTLGVLSIVLD